MWTCRRVVCSFFLGKVAQHLTPQLRIRQPSVQGTQVGWKCGHVMPVFGGVAAQVLARELPLGPGLVKRVLQQVIGSGALCKAGPEIGLAHGGVLTFGKVRATG